MGIKEGFDGRDGVAQLLGHPVSIPGGAGEGVALAAGGDYRPGAGDDLPDSSSTPVTCPFSARTSFAACPVKILAPPSFGKTHQGVNDVSGLVGDREHPVALPQS